MQNGHDAIAVGHIRQQVTRQGISGLHLVLGHHHRLIVEAK